MQLIPGTEADDQASMVGVVAPPRVFERTAREVQQALAAVRTELSDKREGRDRLNEEIRQLVADEDLLRRMARLAGATTNGDEPPP